MIIRYLIFTFLAKMWDEEMENGLQKQMYDILLSNQENQEELK